MIKRQKMLLPFEMSSDLSEEARMVDEMRNLGLKDEVSDLESYMVDFIKVAFKFGNKSKRASCNFNFFPHKKGI